MSRFATVVFLLLVGATFSGFFVAHELKSRPSVIQVNRMAEHFSPNGDGNRDENHISVVVREADEVSLSIVDADGDPVRRLASNVQALPYRPVRVVWDGRDDQGRRAPDGIYRLRVNLRDQGRSVVVQRAITLDTTPPRPVVRVAEGQSVIGPRGRPVRVSVRGGGSRHTPRLVVWRTDVQTPRKVAEFRGAGPGSSRAEWDGLIDGEPAPPGIYLIEAIARDAAGNVGSSAPGLPELPDELRGNPGVTIRALAVQPPLDPQRAGEPVTFLVDARRRAYSWEVRRLGRSRPWESGAVRTGEPRLRVPAPEAPGVHLLEIRSGRYRATVPFLAEADGPTPLLVVAPVITWLGADRIDDDGNGLPNTLENRNAVRWPRPLSGDGELPQGFEDQFAPLLVALDRARVPYQVTSELALVRGEGPDLAEHEGVLLAGALRWMPPDLGRRLRRHVVEGGRVAAIGVESMRRGVTVTDAALTSPTQPGSSDPLGAELLPVARVPAETRLELVREDPELGLFTGSDGVLQGFSVVERSRLQDASRLLAALAPAPGTALTPPDAAPESGSSDEVLPVLAAHRLGRGLVVRVGLAEWGERISQDDEVRQLQHNLVDVLRGVTPRVRTVS